MVVYNRNSNSASEALCNSKAPASGHVVIHITVTTICSWFDILYSWTIVVIYCGHFCCTVSGTMLSLIIGRHCLWTFSNLQLYISSRSALSDVTVLACSSFKLLCLFSSHSLFSPYHTSANIHHSSTTWLGISFCVPSLECCDAKCYPSQHNKLPQTKLIPLALLHICSTTVVNIWNVSWWQLTMSHLECCRWEGRYFSVTGLRSVVQHGSLIFMFCIAYWVWIYMNIILWTEFFFCRLSQLYNYRLTFVAYLAVTLGLLGVLENLHIYLQYI